MIRHIVCLKIKDFASGKTKSENLLTMQKLLLSLKSKISVIKELEVGINSLKADPSNYDIVLVTSLNSMKDLDLYQNHPEHKKVSEFVSKVKESRACIDYEY